MDSTIALGIKEEKEFTLKNWHLYLFVTILYLIVALVNDKFIMTRDVYQQLFSDKMEGYRIDDYYQLIKKFTFYAYLIIPVVTWLKITFIALLLQTPLMLKNIEVSFKETFRIAAIANLPLILRGVVKFTILIFTPRVEYTNDLLSSIPGSITNFISKANYSQVSYNFLSNINIYEAMWVFIVFAGLLRLKKLDKSDAFTLSFGVWLGITLLMTGINIYFTKAV